MLKCFFFLFKVYKMVPQFETCRREIQNFPLAVAFLFFSCVLHNLAFPELSTGSVHFAPDENGRPSEQTNLYCFC